MEPDISISEESRKNVASILGKLLANEFVLYTKTRRYHWNVTGPHFNDYHKVFEGQYDELAEDIDAIAERIRSLGVMVAASLTEFKERTNLEEHPNTYPNAKTMTENLLKDHETIIKSIRSNIPQVGNFGDVGTEDFLTELLEKHEKTAWMLRATLED